MSQALSDPSSTGGTTTALLEGLLARWREGSEFARDDLFQYVHDRLSIICRARLGAQDRLLTAAEIDDIVQDAMTGFLNALETIEFEGPRHFLNIANKHLDWAIKDLCRRAKKFHEKIGTTALLELAGDENNARNIAELLQALMARVEQLPADERLVFQYYFYHDLSHAEIAALLGISVRTSVRRLVTARYFLAKIFE